MTTTPAPVAHSQEYDYFKRPSPSDPWTPKITGWQRRERAETAGEVRLSPASVSGQGRSDAKAEEGSLHARYLSFRAERKRQMARELADWMQAVAKRHNVPDGLVDHWATLKETLDNNGDDCDGLELLAYYFLKEHGFADDEVFRAVIYRPSDGQHHMVTLWFEDRSDPWVIDPTGAMTSGMPRLSTRPDWVPLKLFTENQQFTVQQRGTRTEDVPGYPSLARARSER